MHQVYEDTNVNFNMKTKLRLLYFQSVKGMASASVALDRSEDARQHAIRYYRATGEPLANLEDELDRREAEKATLDAERLQEQSRQQLQRAQKGLPAGWKAVLCSPNNYSPPSLHYECWGTRQSARPTRSFALKGRLVKISGKR